MGAQQGNVYNFADNQVAHLHDSLIHIEDSTRSYVPKQRKTSKNGITILQAKYCEKIRRDILNIKNCAFTAAVALLGSALLCSTAFAADQGQFSAIQGLDAQPLTVQEMHAVSGELNAYDIAAALTAEAAKLAKAPKLQAADLKLAAYFSTNAVAINAAFKKLGILTACKSCK